MVLKSRCSQGYGRRQDIKFKILVKVLSRKKSNRRPWRFVSEDVSDVKLCITTYTVRCYILNVINWSS